MTNSIAALTTKTKMNPMAPEAAEYFDREQIAYILDNGDRQIVLTSFGGLGRFEYNPDTGKRELEEYEVGDRVVLHHDQTGRTMHRWTITGVAHFADTSLNTGMILDRKLAHFVVK